jgi:hypothetical protein
MAGPHRGRMGPRRFLRDQNRCTSLRIFCTDRFALRWVCDRSLEILIRQDRFVEIRGGRYPPGSAFASILPGLQLLPWPVSALFTRGRS